MSKRNIFKRFATGFRTRKNMKELHSDLRILFYYMMYFYDFSLLDAHRPKKEQMEVFEKGWSKAQWLQSAHNYLPALAGDVTPYPIRWQDIQDQALFIGRVIQAASDLYIAGIMEHRIKSGATWSKKRMKDNSFIDAPHVELLEWRSIRRHGLSIAGEEIKFQEKLVKLKKFMEGR